MLAVTAPAARTALPALLATRAGFATAASARRVYVVGGHSTRFLGKGHPEFIHKKHPDFGKRENPDIKDYIKDSIQGALTASGASAAQVEKVWVGNFAGELFIEQGHLAAAVTVADPALLYKPSMRVEGACASGGLAFAAAVDAVRAGMNIGLVCGAEVQNTVSAREGGAFLARAADFKRERVLDDFTFPAVFALRMKMYRTEFNVSEKEIASISMKAYGNANKNPLAHMHFAKMTLERASAASDTNPNFLSNPELKPWLKVSDCSQVSDGGSAVIIASEEGLRALGKSPADAIEVLACEYAAGDLWSPPKDWCQMDTTVHAARRAFDKAHVTSRDIQVAEVHDCFSVAEALMCEAVGFAERGKGYKLALDGESNIDGRIPTNTGGGLIAFGHPVGATGVKQIVEVCRQMRGECGEYQVPKVPSLGLCANMGGNDKTSVVSILSSRHAQ